MPVTAGDAAADGSAKAGEHDSAVTGTLTIAAGGRGGTRHVPPHPCPALRAALLRLASAAPASAPFDVGRWILRAPLIANLLPPNGWESDFTGAAGERVGRDPRLQLDARGGYGMRMPSGRLLSWFGSVSHSPFGRCFLVGGQIGVLD